MKTPIKNQLSSIKQRNSAVLNQLQETAEKHNPEKIRKIIVYGVGGLALFGVLWLILPERSNGINVLQGMDENAIVRSTVIPLETQDGETWDDFKLKIIADREKDKQLVGTIAYLKKNCNLEISPNQREKYRRTYALVSSLSYLKNAPEVQLLSNCSHLKEVSNLNVFYEKMVHEKYKGRERDSAAVELKQLFDTWAHLQYKEQMIWESRQAFKDVHKDYYDIKTGTFLVINKSPEMLRIEADAASDWERLTRQRHEVSDRVFRLTGQQLESLLPQVEKERERRKEMERQKYASTTSASVAASSPNAVSAPAPINASNLTVASEVGIIQ